MRWPTRVSSVAMHDDQGRSSKLTPATVCSSRTSKDRFDKRLKCVRRPAMFVGYTRLKARPSVQNTITLASGHWIQQQRGRQTYAYRPSCRVSLHSSIDSQLDVMS